MPNSFLNCRLYNETKKEEINIKIEFWIKYLPHMFFVWHRYVLSDGQYRSEEGKYKDGVDEDGNPAKVLVVQGAYSWVATGDYQKSF